MTKYLVRITNVATDANPNYAGEKSIAYYGKDQQMIGYLGTHPARVHAEQPLTDFMIKEYGYNRKCDAKRSYFFSKTCVEHETLHDKFWKMTSREIVAFEV